MRRNEITPELIELSKRAKELGFPQDVERGDWVCDVTDDELYLIETLKEEGDVLILSFSRCLEWLREMGWKYIVHAWEHEEIYVSLYHDETKKCIPEGAREYPEKTHHEAIAKAVVKMLEEE